MAHVCARSATGEGMNESFTPPKQRDTRRFVPTVVRRVPTASRLPRRLYTAEDAAAAPAIECSVCLATFAVGDELRHLPCGHEFHLKCVDAWLLGAAAASADRVSATCPLCNAVPLDVDHLLAEAGAPSATATRDAAR